MKYSIIFLIGFLICNCHPSYRASIAYKVNNINSILVLPFESFNEENKQIFYCPVKGIISEPVSMHAKKTLDKLLKKELEKNSSYKFVFFSENEVENLLSEILEKTQNPKEIIKELCAKTNTQAILYGKVYRFRERIGNAFSVSEPASVAFTLILYEGKTGKILWMRTFDETQKPLSENIFNIKLYGKLKWLTAQELAERGLIKIFSTFPAK